MNDEMFCNLKEKCFSFNDKCMNLDVTESEMKKKSLENLLKESSELTAIFMASRKTTNRK